MLEKIHCLNILILLFIFTSGLAWAYGENSNQYERWVEGRITYSDGSKCGQCGPISIETEDGFSKQDFTDNNGNFRVHISSDYVKSIYFKGSKVWSGNKSTKGGTSINIFAK